MHACMHTYIHTIHTFIHTYRIWTIPQSQQISLDYMHAYIHSYIQYIHLYIHTEPYIHICIHTYTYIHAYIQNLNDTPVSAHLLLYACIHRLYACMHTYIHTSIHTYMHAYRIRTMPQSQRISWDMKEAGRQRVGAVWVYVCMCVYMYVCMYGIW
jgi:hypothetical protein